jgi:hypothetical protein
MQNPIGLLILIVFSGIIVMLRGKIQTSDNVYLKKAAQIGDWYIWFRFIMGLIMVSFFLFILSRAHR